MKIARYRSAAGPERLGVVTVASGREQLVDVATATAARGAAAVPASVMALIEGGPAAMDTLRELLAWAGPRGDPAWLDDPDDVQWLTPVPPRSMLCAGRNFGRHKQASMQARPAGARPLHSDFPTGFVKLGRTLVPHRSQVQRPAGVFDLDYEAEVVLVLGQAIDADHGDLDPARAIFGYTVFNDLSARQWQLREMDNGMLMMGKNFPGFGPLGPVILTADDVPDPTALTVWLKVNGELRQQADCRDLIFGFEALVAFWSRVGLVPGDLVSTGTPDGVALHHTPDPHAWYLQPGDRVEAGVDGIGVLETFIV